MSSLFLGCNPFFETQIGGAGVPFAQRWNFDASPDPTQTYAFDANKIDFSGGVCRLTGNDQIDDGNTASGFGGGSSRGVAWDASNAYLRLANSGGCDGTLTDCNPDDDLSAAWVPQSGDLVGLWHLNETSLTAGVNNDFKDQSTSNKYLESQGAATPGATGKLTYGISLDGTATSFLKTSASHANTAPYTVCVWAKPASITPAATQTLVANGAGIANYRGFSLKLSTAGKFTFSTQDEVTATAATATATTNASLSWNHVCGSWDGTTGANSVNVYLNGANVGMGTPSGSGVPGASLAPLYVGANSGGAGRWIGSLDEVAVWDSVLLPSEISAIYARQSSKYSGTFTSRVMDAFAVGMNWNTLSWVSTLPFFKETPSALQSETSSDYSALVGSTGSVNDNNLMTGILGIWHLNEAAGTTGAGSVKDGSGNGRTGAPTGAVVFGSSGRLGTGIGLDGTSSSIAMTSAVLDEPPVTVCVWALPSTLSFASRYIVSNGVSSATKHGVGLYIDTSNRYYFHATSYVGGIGGTAAATASLGWSHVCGTWDGTTGANKVILYINGVSAATGTAGAVATGAAQNNLSIGIRPDNGTSWFTGNLDEIALWSRVLQPSEVFQLYRRGVNRIKYQVRACTSSDCSDDAAGANWKGSSGTAQSYLSELNNNSVPLDSSGSVKKTAPSLALSAFTNPIGTSRYFQYRAILESDDTSVGCDYGSGPGSCSPELKSVTVDPVHYDSSSPTVIGKTGVSFSSLSAFAETLGSSCASGVGYNLGLGSSYASATWYWWSSSAGRWVSANGTVAQSNSAAVIHSHASGFGGQAGTGTVYFKAFLTSSGDTKCELDALQIDGQ